MEFNQIPNQPQIPARKQDLSASSESALILPRQGWQNKRAFAQAIVKAKKALDIAEITHLLS